MSISERDEKVEQALAKLVDLDSIILRPKPGDPAASLDLPAGAERRIALLEHQELEQQIKQAPADPLPYVKLAKLYQSQGRWKDTLRVLEAGVQHNADYEPLVELREDLLLAAAEREQTEAHQAHLQRPTAESALHCEGRERNLAEEQLRFCQQRLARHPEQTELKLRWARALRALGRYEDAIQLLNGATLPSSLRARAQYELGLNYQLSGRALQAISHFRQAALFRDPAPPPDIQQAALKAGMELAEKLHMIETALHFGGEWLQLPAAPTDMLRKRLAALQQQPR
jgi:tetratricopeptide (TPR) repeat protein